MRFEDTQGYKDFDRMCQDNDVYRELKQITDSYDYDCPDWVYWDLWGRLETVFRPYYADLPTVYYNSQDGFLFEIDGSFRRSISEFSDFVKSCQTTLNMAKEISNLNLEGLAHESDFSKYKTESIRGHHKRRSKYSR